MSHAYTRQALHTRSGAHICVNCSACMQWLKWLQCQGCMPIACYWWLRPHRADVVHLSISYVDMLLVSVRLECADQPSLIAIFAVLSNQSLEWHTWQSMHGHSDAQYEHSIISLARVAYLNTHDYMVARGTSRKIKSPKHTNSPNN
jgi:hypothetical protein